MTCMRVELTVIDEGEFVGDPVVIDLRVSENGKVLKNGNVYGAWGKPGYEEFYPFMLNVEGNIDFGGCSDERNAQTNLLDKTIRVGEYCTYQDSESAQSQSLTLQIKDVQSLE